jgi:membrane dipeptidase
MLSKIYEEAIVIDGLNVSNWESEAVYASLKAGGVTAINATVAVWENFTQTMDNIAGWLRRFRARSDLLQVRTADDITRAKREGKVGVFLGFQNAAPIENRLERLGLFHALGVRVIQVTYNERNLLGNGCYERHDEGLSHFGVEAIREMNRLGILIDLSHVGDRTTLDTIEVSQQPVAFTHANARAFHEHPRNKTDEALKLLAQKGGVVGANAFTLFLRRGYDSTLSDYVDAIEDLVDRLGIDHVAIGTDFAQDQPKAFFDWLFAVQGTIYLDKNPLPYPVAHPAGLETPDKFPALADELTRRGYAPADVRKILGENWLRLLRAVWR